MDELKQMLFRLCGADGVSGDESDAAVAAAKEFPAGTELKTDRLGNLTASLGPEKAKTRVLLDAHLDQIGLIVTGIDEAGFLRVDKCGGTDRRVLPGAAVWVLGKERVGGVISVPPASDGGDEEKIPEPDRMAVEIGCTKKEAEKLVRPGNRVVFRAQPRSLLGTRVTAPGLDDRASVAALIRCAQMLQKKPPRCRVIFQLSTREEVGGQGAVTGAYRADPTQAVAVDVSFAQQPGVEPEKSWKLGGGPMIGFAPILDRAMGEELVKLAQESGMPYKRDVMGGETGTNGDAVAVTRAGVRTGLLSIPVRYMHTPAEVVDLRDIENTAKLLASYLRAEAASRAETACREAE